MELIKNWTLRPCGKGASRQKGKIYKIKGERQKDIEGSGAYFVLKLISLYLLTNPLLSMVFCDAIFSNAHPQLGFKLFLIANSLK